MLCVKGGALTGRLLEPGPCSLKPLLTPGSCLSFCCSDQIAMERLGVGAGGDPVGEPAVLCAGFRYEEVVQVRALLDSVGGHGIKVIPCPERVLRLSVEKALAVEEPEWDKPFQEQQQEPAFRGGIWGLKRCLLLGGLGPEAAMAVQGLLENCGLPPLVLTEATQQNRKQVLGEVMARAVRDESVNQGRPKGSSGHFHDPLQEMREKGRVVDRVPKDVEGRSMLLDPRERSTRPHV